ncbi:hypothetical protein HMPREF9955_1677 [Staphylococcus epidermidis FS1]|nr:hypothetical protein HMPREF9955_1677 [Staphylococcus epidermidis FS1]
MPMHYALALSSSLILVIPSLSFMLYDDRKIHVYSKPEFIKHLKKGNYLNQI